MSNMSQPTPVESEGKEDIPDLSGVSQNIDDQLREVDETVKATENYLSCRNYQEINTIYSNLLTDITDEETTCCYALFANVNNFQTEALPQNTNVSAVQQLPVIQFEAMQVSSPLDDNMNHLEEFCKNDEGPNIQNEPEKSGTKSPILSPQNKSSCLQNKTNKPKIDMGDENLWRKEATLDAKIARRNFRKPFDTLNDYNETIVILDTEKPSSPYKHPIKKPEYRSPQKFSKVSSCNIFLTVNNFEEVNVEDNTEAAPCADDYIELNDAQLTRELNREYSQIIHECNSFISSRRIINIDESVDMTKSCEGNTRPASFENCLQANEYNFCNTASHPSSIEMENEEQNLTTHSEALNKLIDEIAEQPNSDVSSPLQLSKSTMISSNTETKDDAADSLKNGDKKQIFDQVIPDIVPVNFKNVLEDSVQLERIPTSTCRDSNSKISYSFPNTATLEEQAVEVEIYRTVSPSYDEVYCIISSNSNQEDALSRNNIPLVLSPKKCKDVITISDDSSNALPILDLCDDTSSTRSDYMANYNQNVSVSFRSFEGIFGDPHSNNGVVDMEEEQLLSDTSTILLDNSDDSNADINLSLNDDFIVISAWEGSLLHSDAKGDNAEISSKDNAPFESVEEPNAQNFESSQFILKIEESSSSNTNEDLQEDLTGIASNRENAQNFESSQFTLKIDESSSSNTGEDRVKVESPNSHSAFNEEEPSFPDQGEDHAKSTSNRQNLKSPKEIQKVIFNLKEEPLSTSKVNCERLEEAKAITSKNTIMTLPRVSSEIGVRPKSLSSSNLNLDSHKSYVPNIDINFDNVTSPRVNQINKVNCTITSSKQQQADSKPKASGSNSRKRRATTQDSRSNKRYKGSSVSDPNKQSIVNPNIDANEINDNNDARWQLYNFSEPQDCFRAVYNQWSCSRMPDAHEDLARRFYDRKPTIRNFSYTIPGDRENKTVDCLSIYRNQIDEVNEKASELQQQLDTLGPYWDARRISQCMQELRNLYRKHHQLSMAWKEAYKFYSYYVDPHTGWNAYYMTEYKKNEIIRQFEVLDTYEPFYGFLD